MTPFRTRRAAAIAAALASAAPVQAAVSDSPAQFEPAAGVELSASKDSDKTSVVKLLGRALWDFEGPQKFRGIELERAWFAPDGQRARKQTRVYIELADSLDEKWKWTARIGTNGKTVLGSASIRSNDWSKEFFVEREIVETPRGVDEGIYYTFAGASADLFATKHDTINAMAGFQKFTGRNNRFHLRGTLVHVIKPNMGLSMQLRGRYFHSSVPGEFDYYSPRDFLQLIPVVQMRRFTRAGWMIVIATGYGGQKATGGSWQAARLADFRIESPASSKMLHAFAQIQYSNSSLTGAAANYHYVLTSLGFTARF